jgi:tryptophan synthase alpha chain
MNRIDQIFSDLRAGGQKALMPFLTAGDPDVPTTGELLLAMQQAGASICELGLAFSDPIADGPVIAASMSHALDQGVRIQQVMDMVASKRDQLTMGLVAMVSYSIVHRTGPRDFISQAKQAGFDGFIFPDLPVAESGSVRDIVADCGMTCSFLIAPSTPIQRAEEIAAACTGFVYVLSRAGLTGERSELPAELPQRLERLRQVTDLPLAVGFGISDAGQVRQVVEVADAAIVGSAIMRRVTAFRDARPESPEPKDAGDTKKLVAQVGSFVSELAQGLNTQADAAGTS